MTARKRMKNLYSLLIDSQAASLESFNESSHNRFFKCTAHKHFRLNPTVLFLCVIEFPFSNRNISSLYAFPNKVIFPYLT